MAKSVKYVGTYEEGNIKGLGLSEKGFSGNDSMQFMGKDYKESFSVQYAPFKNDHALVNVEFSHLLPQEVNFIGKHEFELQGKKFQLVYMSHFRYDIDTKSKSGDKWHIKNYNKETCYLYQVTVKEGKEVLNPLCSNVKPNTVISAIRMLNGNTSHSHANNIYIMATLRRDRFKKVNGGKSRKVVNASDVDFSISLV